MFAGRGAAVARTFSERLGPVPKYFVGTKPQRKPTLLTENEIIESRSNESRRACSARRLRCDGAAVQCFAVVTAECRRDATLSRLINAAPPLLHRKGYKVVLVREPLVPRLAPAGTSDGDLTT